jgi:hypothetical protein
VTSLGGSKRVLGSPWIATLQVGRRRGQAKGMPKTVWSVAPEVHHRRWAGRPAGRCHSTLVDVLRGADTSLKRSTRTSRGVSPGAVT